MSIAEHLILDNGYKFGQVLPLHILALSMEVEPDIVNVRISQALDHLSHLLADPFLASLLINQVDPILLSVVFLRLFDVLLRSLQTLIKVGIDDYRGCPCHSRLHLPDQWNTTSDLKMACNSEGTVGLLLCQYVLSLTEIRGVTFTIEATHDKAATHTTGILS